MQGRSWAAAVAAFVALAAAGPLDTAAAAPPEPPVFAAQAPLALPTISPPPDVQRPMRWARARGGRTAAAGGVSTFAAGRAVVGLSAAKHADALLQQYDVHGVYLHRGLRALHVTGTPERLRALARAVASDRRLRYVEPLRTRSFTHRRNDKALNTIDPATGLPFEWTFARLRVDKALNLSAGSPLILVGVVDSGVAPVPDLTGKVAQTLSAVPDLTDTVGHGTFVSSIIASNNDDGIGLAGFCGACRLVVYKLDVPDDFSIATAITRLTDENVRVLNLSLGGYEYSAVLADAVNYAASRGVLLVAAVGNDGLAQASYPAAFLQPENGEPSIGLAVGASDASGARAPFSNWGTRLSLLAPGSFSEDCRVGVLGAVPTTPSVFDESCAPPFADPETGARYVYSQGTSFSAPEVAGIAALVWAASPRLKSSEIANLLEQSATRPAGAGWNAESGWGVIDAARAVEFATGKSSADRVIVGRPTSAQPPRPGRLFQITAAARWSDGVPVPAGKVSCNVSVGGRVIAVRGQLADGVSLCQWRVPKSSKTQTMQVIATVSDETGVTGTARRAFLVKAVR